MLRSFECPSISLGKGLVMPIAKAKKNVASQGAADRKKEPSSSTFEGKVVSLIGNKLVIRNREGTAFTHTLAKDVKLGSDGKPCKAEDLKAGTEIRVITKSDDRNVITGIECLAKNKETATCCS